MMTWRALAVVARREMSSRVLVTTWVPHGDHCGDDRRIHDVGGARPADLSNHRSGDDRHHAGLLEAHPVERRSLISPLPGHPSATDPASLPSQDSALPRCWAGRDG